MKKKSHNFAKSSQSVSKVNKEISQKFETKIIELKRKMKCSNQEVTQNVRQNNQNSIKISSLIQTGKEDKFFCYECFGQFSSDPITHPLLKNNYCSKSCIKNSFTQNFTSCFQCKKIMSKKRQIISENKIYCSTCFQKPSKNLTICSYSVVTYKKKLIDLDFNELFNQFKHQRQQL